MMNRDIEEVEADEAKAIGRARVCTGTQRSAIVYAAMVGTMSVSGA